MKKIFILMMALMMSFASVNAQTAIETPKFFDNWYVGVGGQAATPLDFNKAFPLNGAAAVVLGKDFTPVFGFNFEDNVWFSSHANGSHAFGVPHFDTFNNVNHNIVRGNYLGVNGTLNFMNLFAGYRGTPRLFEAQGIVGLGWWHVFTPNNSDKSHDDLGAKTGVNFLFNLGKKKAHSIYVQPAVLWNLTTPGSRHDQIAFNKMGAQLALQAGYVYRFKTSNRTHNFKTYDVGAMQSEIDRLNAELARKPKVVEKRVEVEKEVIKEVPVGTSNVTVYFTKGSCELSDAAKASLDSLGQNGVVDVKGYADEVGPEAFNQTLSENRAKAVAEYLTNRGLKVNAVTGYGETGDIVARVVVVSPTK